MPPPLRNHSERETHGPRQLDSAADASLGARCQHQDDRLPEVRHRYGDPSWAVPVEASARHAASDEGHESPAVVVSAARSSAAAAASVSTAQPSYSWAAAPVQWVASPKPVTPASAPKVAAPKPKPAKPVPAPRWPRPSPSRQSRFPNPDGPCAPQAGSGSGGYAQAGNASSGSCGYASSASCRLLWLRQLRPRCCAGSGPVLSCPAPVVVPAPAPVGVPAPVVEPVPVVEPAAAPVYAGSCG